MQDSDVKRWALREITSFTILDNFVCNKTHSEPSKPQKRKRPGTLPQWFTGPLICAHDVARKVGSCKGDSGAPGFSFNYFTDRYQLRGVLHGSIRSCNNQQYPAIFNDVHDPEIMEFIKKQLDTGMKLINTSIYS